MELEKKLSVLQTVYASVLADCVLQMGEEGVIQSITRRKKAEQMVHGKTKAAQMGISSPEEVFLVLSDIFNCAQWVINVQEQGFSAEADACKLCVAARNIGAPCPCYIYCLDPMEGMVKGLNPGNQYSVRETLWNGQKCRVEVRTGL